MYARIHIFESRFNIFIGEFSQKILKYYGSAPILNSIKTKVNAKKSAPNTTAEPASDLTYCFSVWLLSAFDGFAIQPVFREIHDVRCCRLASHVVFCCFLVCCSTFFFAVDSTWFDSRRKRKPHQTKNSYVLQIIHSHGISMMKKKKPAESGRILWKRIEMRFSVSHVQTNDSIRFDITTQKSISSFDMWSTFDGRSSFDLVACLPRKCVWQSSGISLGVEQLMDDYRIQKPAFKNKNCLKFSWTNH